MIRKSIVSAKAQDAPEEPSARMGPALVVQHVFPEGPNPGRFVVRVDTGAESRVDEHGEPNDETYVAYELVQEKLVMFHTWTPDALRGKGLAALVVLEAFVWAETHGKRIVPECSYVSNTFLEKRPDLKRLVDG